MAITYGGPFGVDPNASIYDKTKSGAYSTIGGTMRIPVNQQPASPTGQNQVYTAGVKQNAEDYSDIMGAYKNLIGSASNIAGQQYNPTIQPYQQSADVTSALGNLNELARTGGYDAQGIQDLRARGISPIRSVYANAERDINRRAALAGGQPANYAAIQAKMARDLSSQIADATQNVNAGIAQAVAQGRLSAAPNYGSLAMSESGLSNNIAQKNADTMNQAAQYNLNLPIMSQDQLLKALGGATSLYGTTPALANTFGNQAMQAQEMQNRDRMQQANSAYSLANNMFGKL